MTGINIDKKGKALVSFDSEIQITKNHSETTNKVLSKIRNILLNIFTFGMHHKQQHAAQANLKGFALLLALHIRDDDPDPDTGLYHIDIEIKGLQISIAEQKDGYLLISSVKSGEFLMMREMTFKQLQDRIRENPDLMKQIDRSYPSGQGVELIPTWDDEPIANESNVRFEPNSPIRITMEFLQSDKLGSEPVYYNTLMEMENEYVPLGALSPQTPPAEESKEKSVYMNMNMNKLKVSREVDDKE